MRWLGTYLDITITGSMCGDDMDNGLLESIESFQSYIKDVKKVSEHTVKAYTHDLALFRQFVTDHDLTFHDLRFEDARRFVASLKRSGYAEKSINRILSGIKSFYAYCLRYQMVSSNPFSNVRSMKHERYLPTVLTVEEVAMILDAPGLDFTGIRDRALFSVLYSTGCRLSELLQMNIDEIDLGEGRVLVHGKGGKDRFVFLTKHARKSLELYIPMRENLVKKRRIAGRDADAVFVNKNGKRLTPQGVHYIFHTYMRMLGIEKHVTPHTFRHTFATHILDNNAGIRVVQELLGHASISTTQIYSHVSSRRLKEVYKRSHPHGRRIT